MSKNNLTENQTAVLTRYNFEGGRWFDSVAADLVTVGILKDKKTAKVVLNQLIKKGILSADTTVEEGSTWLELRSHQEMFDLDAARGEEENDEDILGDIQQDLIEGTPADEVADALLELELEEAEVDTVVKEQTVTKTENYTVNEWTDAEDTEWTETVFADGSRTLKRRKKVSGSWRTDYWGAEFKGDKERYTTSKFAKMARAYGGFTHNPISE